MLYACCLKCGKPICKAKNCECMEQSCPKCGADLRISVDENSRENTDVKTLTPELVNSLIRRIEVHAPEKIDGKKHIAVDIYFTGVGLFTIPNENDLEAVISKMTQKTA